MQVVKKCEKISIIYGIDTKIYSKINGLDIELYWIGEKDMWYFVNRWRHLNISRVVLIASGQTIRRFEDDNVCYKCLFDSVVIVRFSLKL